MSLPLRFVAAAWEEKPRHEKRVTDARVTYRRAGEKPVCETLMDEEETDFIARVLLPARQSLGLSHFVPRQHCPA
jgi:hypothetical protein